MADQKNPTPHMDETPASEKGWGPFQTVEIEGATSSSWQPAVGERGIFLTPEYRYERVGAELKSNLRGLLPGGTKVKGRLLRTGWLLYGKGAMLVEYEIVS